MEDLEREVENDSEAVTDGAFVDASSEETSPEEKPRRKLISASAFAVIVGALAVVLVVVGFWAYLAITMPVSVPSLVTMNAKDAEAALIRAHLKAGNATYVVTREFPAGLIVAQDPVPYASAKPGSSVNIRVAIAPQRITMPDVSRMTSDRAEQQLRYVQLTPITTEAYSQDIPTGVVIEQLPRSGDSVMTGSSAVIVVSLGPGVPGATVPQLIGKQYPIAHSIAASATLFAQPRAVTATGTAIGTVVDQAPSAGTVVAVASNVWVSVATPASSN